MLQENEVIGSPAGTLIILSFGKQLIVSTVADLIDVVEINFVLIPLQTVSAVNDTFGFGKMLIESENEMLVHELEACNSI
tara:strand:- start:11 stop:250 length:240 start_codon:yes stop_codon:yes gene_type:complete